MDGVCCIASHQQAAVVSDDHQLIAEWASMLPHAVIVIIILKIIVIQLYDIVSYCVSYVRVLTLLAQRSESLRLTETQVSVSPLKYLDGVHGWPVHASHTQEQSRCNNEHWAVACTPRLYVSWLRCSAAATAANL